MKPMIKNEDLKNVNGGNSQGDDITECPNCRSRKYDTITEGSGCNTIYHFTCRDCGTKWSEGI